MDFLITTRNGKTTITFIDSEGKIFDTVTSDHVNYSAIYKAITSDTKPSEQELRELIQPAEKITETLQSVSNRFTYEDGQLKFDGAPVLDVFGKQLLRILKDTAENADDTEKQAYLAAVAKFGEKIMENDAYHVRNSVMQFVSDRDLTITQDGNILAYKGVMKKPLLDADGKETEVEEFHSIHSGPADVVKVNGEFVGKGQVPNPVGATVEMARRHVDDNPNNHCSNGLHAGSYSYARDFGKGGLLMVEVDPRDIVTVPPDHNCQKLRVSKYVILETTETEYNRPVYTN